MKKISYSLIIKILAVLVLIYAAYLIYEEAKSSNIEFEPINNKKYDYDELDTLIKENNDEFYIIFGDSKHKDTIYFLENIMTSISFKYEEKQFTNVFFVDTNDCDAIDYNNLKNKFNYRSLPFIVRINQDDNLVNIYNWNNLDGQNIKNTEEYFLANDLVKEKLGE